jgi:RNA polymerase sigma-70 factor (ECF subfamily)
VTPPPHRSARDSSRARPARRDVTKSALLHPLGQAGAADSAADYAALVRAAARGESEAMERLLMRAQEIAWRFSLTVCGHADDAEDAMQEALMKTFRHLGQVRDAEAFRPWLYRTVRNACLMGRRRRVHEPARLESLEAPAHRKATPPFEPVDPGRTPDEIVDNRRLRRRLLSALATLPAPYRAIVFLREMEGLSTREVAQVMGISEVNVKTRLHRARVALQSVLSKEKQ